MDRRRPRRQSLGGDRLTAETLRLHRGLAVERHRRSVQELARRLSVSGRRCPPPEALTAWLDARRPLPAHVAYLEQRYAGEPYRLALSLLAADLEAASAEDMTARLLDEAPHPARATAAEVRKVVALVARGVPPALAGDRVGRSSSARGLRPARGSSRRPGRLGAARRHARRDPGPPGSRDRLRRPRRPGPDRGGAASAGRGGAQGLGDLGARARRGCRPRPGASSVCSAAPRPSTGGRRSAPSSSR